MLFNKWVNCEFNVSLTIKYSNLLFNIFQRDTNFSKKDSNNWIYYINKSYFDNFNGKNKCEKTTSNIQDVCAMKHPSLLRTLAQMEKIAREDKHRNKRDLESEQRAVDVHWQRF